jgi:digeranylgeranylglycerophospholipid reductase
MDCDILVVGAGPAGSMAAKTAAEKNENVVLINRNKKIGYPVRCAEGINKFLFRDTGIKKDDSFIEQIIDGTKIHFYDEAYDLKTDQWRGYTINRTIFDKYLAIEAEKAGAKLLTATKAVGMKRKGNRWLIKTKSEKGLDQIETKIVIGADGVECNIGRWAGISRNWKENEVCKCYELFLKCPNISEDNNFHIAFGEEFPMGYAWIFPKNKKANVGVGVTPKKSAKNALHFFINKYPGVETLIGENYSLIEKRGGSIPTAGPKDVNEIIYDGIIVVGDAAGMVDPITGEGICPSMISGISAGETALLCLEKNNWDKENLNEYQQRWMRKRYINTTLGDNMKELLELREIVYTIFSKNINKSEREDFVSMIQNSL